MTELIIIGKVLPAPAELQVHGRLLSSRFEINSKRSDSSWLSSLDSERRSAASVLSVLVVLSQVSAMQNFMQLMLWIGDHVNK